MKRLNLSLFGFIIALVIGLTLALSQKTLLAQDLSTQTSTKNPAKGMKKFKLKAKKQLNKGFESGNLKTAKIEESKQAQNSVIKEEKEEARLNSGNAR